ncbi:MAG TPA: 50S ribosomal protein L24 [Patescibacteria group bacterium]
MYKLKIGDSVKIVLGKDKGKEGKIEKIFPKEEKVLVPGVNLFKKHVKPAMTIDGKGGVFDIPRPLAVSKIAVICPNCKKQTRVGFKEVEGKKQRICKKCGKQMDLKAKAAKKGKK